ncbi:hypothetical protein BV372_03540, partial [Nostoc sp. T09]|uniref:WD40 repeat domain-containing protein n=1 Tax=Nostoc sp. T09 TaxID=1932621 RepID=UPI000B6BEB10
PDGQKLASGSGDNTIKIWDISTGKAIKTLTGHSSAVNSVVFSPDGQNLASGSDDKTIILWNLDFDDLLRSGCSLLNNYLIAHPEVLEDLPTCQTPYRKEKGATVLVIQGEKLAQNDDINAAVDKFHKAQQWDSNLKFNSKVKAQEFANKGKAQRQVAEGEKIVQDGKVKEAIAAYADAQKIDPKIEISAYSWGTLCWQGSLYKQAADVMFACNQAVKLAPKDGSIRDRRGLARALTGDYQGAISDFEAYIAQAQDYEQDSKAQRQRWVKDLKVGKNPITDDELKRLQNR